MTSSLFSIRRRQVFLIVAVTLTLMMSLSAPAQTYTVLHTFTGGIDGGTPYAGLTWDGGSNFYGTAAQAGYTGTVCYNIYFSSLAAEQPNHSLLRAIARSLQWKERIIAGEVYCKEQLAAEANMNASYVGRILRLGALSPDMVDSVTRHHRISDRSLTRRVLQLPFDWTKQGAALR